MDPKGSSPKQDSQTLFIGPFWSWWGSNEKISELRSIAVANKNKIQFNSADHTPTNLEILSSYKITHI